MIKHIAIAALLFAASCSADDSEFVGTWKFTGGEGTYACSEGQGGILYVNTEIFLDITSRSNGLNIKYSGPCTGGFSYALDNDSGLINSRGDVCTYRSQGDELSAVLLNTVDSHMYFDGEQLIDYLHYEYEYTYSDGSQMNCSTTSVGHANRVID